MMLDYGLPEKSKNKAACGATLVGYWPSQCDDESQTESQSQSDSGSELLLIQIQRVLDTKLAVLKEELATKECISSLQDAILEQSQTID